mgnify:CR=1 FL=1
MNLPMGAQYFCGPEHLEIPKKCQTVSVAGLTNGVAPFS